MVMARWMLVGVAVAVLALGGWAGASADEVKQQGCNKEAKAKVELPEAAAKAIKDAFPGATIDEVEIDNEDGMKMFAVELKQDKAETEVKVTADGMIVEVETEVALKDVPGAAAKVISDVAAAEGAQIKEIKKEEAFAKVKKGDSGNATLVKLDKPKVSFEAELVKGDQKGEIEVDADGKVIEELKWKVKGQDDDDDDDDDAKPEAKS